MTSTLNSTVSHSFTTTHKFGHIYCLFIITIIFHILNNSILSIHYRSKVWGQNDVFESLIKATFTVKAVIL